MGVARSSISKIIEDKQELVAMAQELLKLRPERLVVLLAGEPGAGKTEFVKAFVKALAKDRVAFENQVTSPTFALHQSYEIEADSLIEVDHWDLYRLESEDDLESSGFWDQFSKSQFLVFIEWPERVSISWFPKNIETWKIDIEKLDVNKRRVSLSFFEN